MILKKKVRKSDGKKWMTCRIFSVTIMKLRHLKEKTGYGQSELIDLAITEFAKNLRVT